MSKPVILTGIRSNSDLQIGNYLGAMLPLIDMAKNRSSEYQLNLFVPDLHSFTTPIDHSKLYGQTIENLKVYAAAGLPLDNPSVFIYRQSYVPAHSELTWILDCFTGMGEMNRMTQYKDKSAKLSDDRVSVGLFNYPVLMACDILLYNAEYVPVGDDQSQHLEYTRDIAERMNSRFGDLFVVPKPVAEQHAFFGKDQGLRIMDLLEPTKKMSKSDETGKGVIFLSDSPESAAKKIMGATTDSFGEVKYDRKERPGISNLLQILALLTSQDLEAVVAKYKGQTSYGDLKKDVASAVSSFLNDFQAKLARVDEATVLAKLERDEATMREQAGAVLLKVQKAVGLRPVVSGAKNETVADYVQSLDQLGIKSKVVEHPASRKIAEVIKSLGLRLEDTMPTFIMHGDGRFIAAVIRGESKVDPERVKAELKIHDLRMAAKDEFTRVTGVPLGAARVYTPNLITIIDNKVFEQEYLTGGSGSFDCSVRYRTRDLKKIPGVKIADISTSD